MNIMLIGDTHLYHKRMEQYCGRPEDFTETVLTNLIGMGINQDLLIHLGDICIGNDVAVHERLSLIFPKVLCKGNHDSKSYLWYYNQGWSFVCENFSLDVFGYKIVFSHRPMPEVPEGFINVCAHVHNNPNTYYLPGCYPFVLEDEDYKPVSLQKFLERRVRNVKSNS